MSERHDADRAGAVPARAALRSIASLRVFVRELGPTRAFFRDVVGLAPRFDDPQATVAIFDTGGPILVVEAVEPGDAEGEALVGRFTGISFASDDVASVYTELVRRGVEFLEPPERQPWGGVLAHFRDPAGNVYSILEQPGAPMHD